MKGALLLVGLVSQYTMAVGRDPYKLADRYMNEDFFSRFDFWTAPDPSNGTVQYVDRATAQMMGLAKVVDDHIYLGADSHGAYDVSSGRRSVRIQSKDVYNSGLFVISLPHIPAGCGTWPAFWMYGEDPGHVWPAWGEYDIVETIHTQPHALTTLHTGAGCDQSMVAAGQDFTGTWDVGATGAPATNCNVHSQGQYENQGCSQTGPTSSAGTGFNSAGGGTFAAEWDPEAHHIRTWFWPPGAEPDDVVRKSPDPEMWGLPYSYFSLRPEACSADHFTNMRLVFSLTFCGDLGDAKFAEMCPEHAGMTCSEFVASRPEYFSEAYWHIEKLDVYQRQSSSSADEGATIFASHDDAGLVNQHDSGHVLNNRMEVFGILFTLVVLGCLASSAVALVIAKPGLLGGIGPFIGNLLGNPRDIFVGRFEMHGTRGPGLPQYMHASPTGPIGPSGGAPFLTQPSSPEAGGPMQTKGSFQTWSPQIGNRARGTTWSEGGSGSRVGPWPEAGGGYNPVGSPQPSNRIRFMTA